MSKSWIYAAIAAGTFPAPYRLSGGRAVYWDAEQVDAFLEKNLVTTRPEIL